MPDALGRFTTTTKETSAINSNDRPDKTRREAIASAGVGSPHYLIGEFSSDRAGISLTHVPDKGAVQ